jgi:hypothetical protein
MKLRTVDSINTCHCTEARFYTEEKYKRLQYTTSQYCTVTELCALFSSEHKLRNLI